MRCKVTLSVAASFIEIEVRKGFLHFRKRILRLHKTSHQKKRRGKSGQRRTLKSWMRLLQDMRGAVALHKVVIMEKGAFPPGFYALYYALIFWWTPGIVIRRVPDLKREFVIESDVDVNIKKGGVLLWKRRQMF